MGSRRPAPDDPPRWAQIFVAGESWRELPRRVGPWLRSRPAAELALIRRFPPHSIVILPAPQERGGVLYVVVRGYDRAGRYLLVAQHDWFSRDRWERVRPDGAELWRPWRGLTPERVAELLAEGAPRGGRR